MISNYGNQYISTSAQDQRHIDHNPRRIYPYRVILRHTYIWSVKVMNILKLKDRQFTILVIGGAAILGYLIGVVLNGS